MRRTAPSVAVVFMVACTASRCDPSPSFSIRPVPDGGVISTVGCPGCTAERVSAGAFHTCAVLRTPDGYSVRTYCFGRNHAGQLGEEVPLTEASPFARELTDPSNDVAGGVATCFADSAAGHIECAGTFALAAQTLSTEEPPANAIVLEELAGVPDLPPDGFSAVSVGMSHACAIDALGQVWCWGSNVV